MESLRANTPLLLTEDELHAFRGINEKVSVREVEEIIRSTLPFPEPACRRRPASVPGKREFMGAPAPDSVPYIIGIAGSVAVGKSTFSRVLRAALARWPDHPNVALVTTDGFLHPNCGT